MDVTPRELELNDIAAASVSPDVNYIHVLEHDPGAAWSTLRDDIARITSDSNIKYTLGRKLAGIAKFFATDPRRGCETMLSHKFLAIIAPLIIQREHYDITSVRPGSALPIGVNYAALGFLSSATQAFVCALRCLHASIKPLLGQAMQQRQAVEASILPSVRKYWTILWDFRSTIFGEPLSHTSFVSFGPDTVDGSRTTLGAVIASCVLETWICLEQLRMGTARQNTADPYASEVLLLSWTHVAGQPTTLALELIYYVNDYLSHVYPQEASVWFAKAIPGTEEKLWFSRALRRTLIKRVDDSRVIVELLSVFVRLSCRTQLFVCIEELKGSRMAPLFWIMKAVQRQVCMGDGNPDCDRMIFGDAVLGLINWCRCTQLNLLEVLHRHFRIPWIPFLGRTFVVVACDPPNNHDTGFCPSTLSTYSSWLKELRRSDPNDVFLQPETTRRCWISTLNELRAGQQTQIRTETTDVWLRLGREFGYTERSSKAWLENHPRNVEQVDFRPWQRCAWTECPCHQYRPLHRLAACKRCWSAYYCTERCQEQDWKAGHRKRCVGHRTKGGAIR